MGDVHSVSIERPWAVLSCECESVATTQTSNSRAADVERANAAPVLQDAGGRNILKQISALEPWYLLSVFNSNKKSREKNSAANKLK